MSKFTIGESVKCKFGGFSYKFGKSGWSNSWEKIEATFTEGENDLIYSQWKPSKEFFTKASGEKIKIGTIDEQEYTVFNNLSHVLEAFGVNRSEVSTAATFKGLYELLDKAGKPFIGKNLYVKTVPNKKGVTELGRWFPFTSEGNDLKYSKKELELFEEPTEQIDISDIPF